MMKKILSILMLLVVSVIAHAQQDVTRFLGIPVDGTRSEMIRKLQAKGFRYDSANDWLTGEFNGAHVRLSVVTNNNKVYRIVVCEEKYFGETDIRIRFNRLVGQFKNNSKYTSFGDFTIPDDEDISYEITVHDKRYEADFYQISESDWEAVSSILFSKYTAEQFNNPTDEIRRDGYSLLMERVSKKSVWFIINSFSGKYNIVMYYDNEYNQANGEDL